MVAFRCQLVVVAVEGTPGIGACLLGCYESQGDVVDCLMESTAPMNGVQVDVYHQSADVAPAAILCKVVVVKKELITFTKECAGVPSPPYSGYFDVKRTTRDIAFLRLWIDRKNGVFAKAAAMESLAHRTEEELLRQSERIDALERTSHEQVAQTTQRLHATESLSCTCLGSRVNVFKEIEPIEFEIVD